MVKSRDIVKIYENHQIVLVLLGALSFLILLYLGLRYFKRLIKRAVDARVTDEIIAFEYNKLSSIGGLIAMIATNWKNHISRMKEMQDQLRDEVKSTLDGEAIEKSLRVQQQILKDMSEEIGKFHTLYKADKTIQMLNLFDSFQDAKEIWKHALEDIHVTLTEETDRSLYVHTSKNHLLQLFLSIIDHMLRRFKEHNITNGFIHVVIKQKSGKNTILMQDNDSFSTNTQTFMNRTNQSKMMLSLYTTNILIQDLFHGEFTITKNQIGTLFEVSLGESSVA